MTENTQDSGADAQEPATKIVIYVRNSKLPDEIKEIISDPIETNQYKQVLEALLKIPIKYGSFGKTIFIPPGKKPRVIKIRRKDLAWLDETKGDLSRSGWIHYIIKEYKKSGEVKP